MEAIFTTLTDQQRVEALNNIYKKGISTPKENLAFSADKLVYLKPFISRLQLNDAVDHNLGSRMMIRNVIDELLKDILEEIDANSPIGNGRANKVALEYGLHMLVADYQQEDFYYTNKVA